MGQRIASGQLGGIFNLKGVEKIRALQDIAVKKSRLGIPLIVGMDVIHGYETIFPIPLALSCSWDIPAIENMARISALEATADGINWVYSPMVDICVDARWGRIAEGNGEDPVHMPDVELSTEGRVYCIPVKDIPNFTWVTLVMNVVTTDSTGEEVIEEQIIDLR